MAAAVSLTGAVASLFQGGAEGFGFRADAAYFRTRQRELSDVPPNGDSVLPLARLLILERQARVAFVGVDVLPGARLKRSTPADASGSGGRFR